MQKQNSFLGVRLPSGVKSKIKAKAKALGITTSKHAVTVLEDYSNGKLVYRGSK